ncbi:MAG: MAPEG family protein [Brachymonas sp.]
MPSISALTCAALALLITALSLHISRLRIRHRVSFSDGGHKELLVAMRAHGNTLEQSMPFGLLLLVLELHRPGAQALVWVAAVFVGARVLHSAAMLSRQLLLRQIAHGVSVLCLLALVAGLLRATLA